AAEPVQALVLRRWPVVVRAVTAPTALDPAHDHWRVRPLVQDVPDALAELPQRPGLVAAQRALGEDDDALAGVQRRDRFLQLRGLAAVARELHADGLDDVLHQPAQ